jgi:hypothetical protein
MKMRETSTISDDRPKTISHINTVRLSIHMLTRGQLPSSNAALVASKPVVRIIVTPPPRMPTSSRMRAKGQ